MNNICAIPKLKSHHFVPKGIYITVDKLSLSREQLIVEQRKDEKMSSLFEAVVPIEQLECVSQGYFVEDGVLMRKWRPSNTAAADEWQIVKQVVVPSSYRSENPETCT